MVIHKNIVIRGRTFPARQTIKGLRFRSLSTNTYTTSKRLYSMTGEGGFIIEVTSASGKGKPQRTTHNVLATSSNVRANFKQLLEKAKTTAKAEHYDKLGYDMTDFSGKLIKKLVYFKLIDYIFRYNRFYSTISNKPQFKYTSEVEKRKVKGKMVSTRFNKIYEYNPVKKRYNLWNINGTPSKEVDYGTKNIRNTLRDYDLEVGYYKKSEYSGDNDRIFDDKFRFAQNNK